MGSSGASVDYLAMWGEARVNRDTYEPGEPALSFGVKSKQF
jgi:hypothetical protein